MSTTSRLLLPLAVLGCSFALSTPTAAAQRSNYNYLNPASACQLSIPTTDTQVRPKATGYRNESTTKSAFVICGYGKPSGTDVGYVTYLALSFYSIDGAPHGVSCTAVGGLTPLVPPVYSTKTLSIPGPGYIGLAWNPADFGGTTEIPGGFAPSVTCTLPPQTAITLVTDQYNLEVGN